MGGLHAGRQHVIWRFAGTAVFSDWSQLVALLLAVVGSRQQRWLSQSPHCNQDLLAAPAGEQINCTEQYAACFYCVFRPVPAYTRLHCLLLHDKQLQLCMGHRVSMRALRW